MNKNKFLEEIKIFKEEIKKVEIDKIIEELYLKLYFMKTMEIYLENKKDNEEIEELLIKYNSIYDIYKKFLSCSEYTIHTNGDIEEMLEY